MIVIEGSDGVGKTTAARRLVELFPEFEYKHMGPPPEDFDHVGFYCDGKRGARIVWDRYHLGEEVYGVALELSRHGTPMERALVRTWLRHNGAVVAIVYAESDGWLRDRWGDKPELYDGEKVFEANKTYRQMAKTGWADMAVDVCQGWPSDDMLRRLVQLWRARQVPPMEEFRP